MIPGVGSFALSSNNGAANTAISFNALGDNTTGNSNTAIGHGALVFNTTGNDNIALGTDADSGVTTANNVICIGSGVDGANVSDSCHISKSRLKHLPRAFKR